MESVQVELLVDPDHVGDAAYIRTQALARAGRVDDDQTRVRVLRRSIDARAKMPRFLLRVVVGGAEPQASVFQPQKLGGKRAIVVGAGPSGYFAALTLLEAGIQPIILERGQDVRTRLKDVQKIYTKGLINPHSNYCFGEGGAGAYSDGKLFTRSKKRGDTGRILDLLVTHGASPEIRVDAHAHLGSNALPKILRAMRASIEGAGGEIHFNAHVADFLLDAGTMRGVRLSSGDVVEAGALVLATGHSARDIYELIDRWGLAIEAKPFALGVRIEHPQELVDQMFYHHTPRHPALPAASYRLACQTGERGVFTFCMCPGGFIVPAATAAGELVLNGMSLASRKAPFANAGLVVEIRPEDVPGDAPLRLLRFQAAVEQAVFAAGDRRTQRAPAQRASDFLAGRVVENLGTTSYLPGIYSTSLDAVLPEFVTKALRQGLEIMGRKHKGFDSAEATLLAVESRTSSAVRIPRDVETGMHPAVSGLFPCGEGAGYAGGIVSAALDGVAVAGAVARYLK